MRYFLDTEYNGWRGELLALALVPDDGGEEFYITLDCVDPIQTWVQENVIPYLDMVPAHLRAPRLAPKEAARALSAWLIREHETPDLGFHTSRHLLEVLADWPEDISLLCGLLTFGPGLIVEVPPIRFTLLNLPGFSTAANSKVPHNALHDARALRDHVLAME